MEIVIVTPPFDILKSGYGTKSKGRYGYWPPLGPGFLAAAIKKKGHKVSFIDSAAEGYTIDDILSSDGVYMSDIIMVSTLTANKEAAYQLVREIKDNYPEKIIMMGGPHTTCFPDDTMNDLPELTAVCIGEGETTAAEFVECISNNEPLEKVDGIYYRNNNNEIFKNNPRTIEKNLDNFHPLDWEIYNLTLYEPLPLQYKGTPIFPYITSRGCPWRKCTFCYESKMGTAYRRHSPERVIADIKELISKYGAKEIAFWDDNFMVNEPWIKKFITLLEEEKINIKWQAYGRVNTVTKQMLKECAEAGCWNIFYGFETGNQETLDRIKKGATLDQARQAAIWTKEVGMDIRGSFMIALPGETPTHAIKTVNFAIELDCTFAQFLPVFPEPGTELYEDALKAGKIEKHTSYQGRTKATYVPEGFKGPEEVEQTVKKVYRKFYYRPSYMIKHLLRIKSIEHIKQYFKAFIFIKGIAG